MNHSERKKNQKKVITSTAEDSKRSRFAVPKDNMCCGTCASGEFLKNRTAGGKKKKQAKMGSALGHLYTKAEACAHRARWGAELAAGTNGEGLHCDVLSRSAPFGFQGGAARRGANLNLDEKVNSEATRVRHTPDLTRCQKTRSAGAPWPKSAPTYTRTLRVEIGFATAGASTLVGGCRDVCVRVTRRGIGLCRLSSI